MNMIDFQNSAFVKLRLVGNDVYSNLIQPLIVQNEQIICSFQSIRDGIVFTNKRVISINLQGITGKKKDITSLPYSKIQAFSIETSGLLDLDSELELWFSGLGKVRLEFINQADLPSICRLISEYIL